MFQNLIKLFDRRSSLSTPPQWLTDALAGERRSTAGVTINEMTGLEVSAVFACVRVISEAIASLPLFVYRRDDADNRSLASDHPLFKVLHLTPNPEMTSYTFRETMQAHVLIYGNGYAKIVRDGALRPRQLVPLLPDRTTPRRNAAGELEYELRASDGITPAGTLPARDVLHLPGLSFDGLVGYAPLALAKETIGLAKAAEQMAGAFYGNNSAASGVLEYDGTLEEDTYKRLRENWEGLHKGPENAYKVAILEQGMTFKPLTIAGREAQFLESRRFAVEEIARRFNVPPSMIQDNSRSTFSNVEQQALNFLQYTIRPWLIRWEQELTRKLFSDPRVFAEHRVEGLLRADFNARMAGYATGRQWGWLSANDIRRLENLNAIGGGDDYLTPLNMGSAGGEAGNEAGNDAGSDAEPEPDADAEPPSRSRHDRIAAAHEALMTEGLVRIYKRERDRLMRASKRPDFAGKTSLFTNWLQGFYDEQEQIVRGTLIPCVDAFASSVNCELYEDELGQWTADAARQHVAESKQQILASIEREGGLVTDEVRGIVDGWKSDRIANESNELMVSLADLCVTLQAGRLNRND